MPIIRTPDPVLAVLVRDVADHEKTLEDHEDRIRPLERMSAKLTVLAFIGASVGAAVANLLLQRLGG